LTPLIGGGGVTAICDRSLHLTQTEIPGARTGPYVPSAGFAIHTSAAVPEQQEPAAATEVAVAVLGTGSELLALFIGESLTIRVLHEAWPDDFPDHITLTPPFAAGLSRRQLANKAGVVSKDLPK
jgi:hypothetical protein